MNLLVHMFLSEVSLLVCPPDSVFAPAEEFVITANTVRPPNISQHPIFSLLVKHVGKAMSRFKLLAEHQSWEKPLERCKPGLTLRQGHLPGSIIALPFYSLRSSAAAIVNDSNHKRRKLATCGCWRSRKIGSPISSKNLSGPAPPGVLLQAKANAPMVAHPRATNASTVGPSRPMDRALALKAARDSTRLIATDADASAVQP